jgi:hypothetical protein
MLGGTQHCLREFKQAKAAEEVYGFVGISMPPLRSRSDTQYLLLVKSICCADWRLRVGDSCGLQAARGLVSETEACATVLCIQGLYKD